jgi:carboxyl-terminal processing protease
MTASEPSLTREERAAIARKIKSLVLEKHVNVANPAQDYVPWTREFDRRLEEVVAAPSRDAFENGVGSILHGLGSSHTAFYHKVGDRIPPQHAINASLRAMEINGKQHWVLLNIIEDGPAHRAGVKPGDVLYSCDGKLTEPPNSPRFQLGGTHELQLGEIEGSGTRSVKVEVPNRAAKDRPPMVEPKSITYRVAAPGTGMIRVASFPGAVGLSFARALDSAITALARESCSRLIIDLRGNLGGGLGSLRLMSYLCPGKLPIGYSMSRTGIKRGWSKESLPRIGKIPAGKLGLLGMAVKFKILHRDRSMVLETEGLGKQSFHGHIVIVIDEFSHSAAEMVAAFAKEHQLAILVGNRTAGEVLGGANFRVGNGYYLRMPIAGWYTWQGDCIEGTGVTPDVAVDADLAALARGEDVQIAKALETVAML